MPLSNYAENQILDAFFGDRSGTFTLPWTAVYVGFSSTLPTKTSGGTEPSGGAYARVQVTAAAMDAAATLAGYGHKDNGSALTFTQASATWASGSNLPYITLWDALSAGNFLGWIVADTAKPVTSGDTAEISAGDLNLTFAATES